jgi:hypothetical protein
VSRARAALILAIGVIAAVAVSVWLMRASVALPSPLPTAPDRFIATLLQNRYGLSLMDGQLSGSGGRLLALSIARSRFILVGENHGFAQTSAFSAAVCNAADQERFRAIAVEEGPLIAAALERWVGERDGLMHLAAFVKTFPKTINLSSTRDEYEMLQACTRASSGELHVWGLNQEAPGAGSFILSRIAEGELGSQSRAAIQRLLRKSHDGDRKALRTDTDSDLFMVSADEADLARVEAVLRKDGSAEARSLFASLVEGHEINRLSPVVPENAQRRELVMKREFMGDYAHAERQAGTHPKVLLKLGAYHVYRGLNPVGGTGIGSYIAELAEEKGAQSLHIRVLPVNGVATVRSGRDQPAQVRRFDLRNDPTAEYLRPALDHLFPTEWTMFDLRPLRQRFTTFPEAADPQWARLVSGIDILIMVPDATPSSAIR